MDVLSKINEIEFIETPVAYKEYPSMKQINNTVALKDLIELGYDSVIKTLNDWEEIEKQNIEISKLNLSLFDNTLTFIKAAFTLAGLSWFKDDEQISKGLSKEASSFLNSLATKYNIYPPKKPVIQEVIYNNTSFVSDISYFSSNKDLIQAAFNKMDTLEKESSILKESYFQQALRLIKKYNLDTSTVLDEASLIQKVNSFMQDKWLKETLPDNTEINLAHNECMYCDVYIVGQPTCGCGFTDIKFTISGDYMTGYKAFATAK